MSILANKTERKAITELAKCLKYFDNLSPLQMTAADAFEARQAERLIRGIIESNGYRIQYRGNRERIYKDKTKTENI